MELTLSHIEANIDARIKGLIAGVEDFGETSDAIAMVMENSIRKNFTEGGRPEKWEVSKRAEKDSGQTLRDSDVLMNSITGVGSAQEAKAGTNVAYGPAHNFGVDEQITQQVRQHVRRISQAFGKDITPREVTVKAHSRSMHLVIPQREFMMLQEMDWLTIEELVTARINKLF